MQFSTMNDVAARAITVVVLCALSFVYAQDSDSDGHSDDTESLRNDWSFVLGKKFHR